ncbi:MAG TPA: hypothetical protein VMT70_19280 [Vicinamibacteria bacterium]|nr:hypothetical protein [Vicinamibacteria bacterium]
MTRSMVVALAVVAAGSLPAAAGERGPFGPDAGREFTLGVVQRELKPGLSQADVAERLGAPNLVTRDAEGREAWVYDRVATELEASSGSVGIGGLGSGGGSSWGGLLGIVAGKRSEKAKTSQRTLTVVVRFSAAGAVERYSWHSSQF